MADTHRPTEPNALEKLSRGEHMGRLLLTATRTQQRQDKENNGRVSWESLLTELSWPSIPPTKRRQDKNFAGQMYTEENEL